MVVWLGSFSYFRLRSSCDLAVHHIHQYISLSHLPCPLEPAAGAGQRHGLIHHPFTDTQVLVDPLVHLLVVAGNLVCLDTGPGEIPPKEEGHMLANEVSCAVFLVQRKGSCRCFAYVKPVERFMPAKKAETVDW